MQNRKRKEGSVSKDNHDAEYLFMNSLIDLCNEASKDLTSLHLIGCLQGAIAAITESERNHAVAELVKSMMGSSLDREVPPQKERTVH